MTQRMTVDELRRATAKPHKFNARRVVGLDDINFPSQREADRWAKLRHLEKLGAIKNLRRQVRYKLVMTTYYVSDFEYDWAGSGKHVVEDTKGYRTPLYKRKKRLMQQQHGIEIKET